MKKIINPKKGLFWSLLLLIIAAFGSQWLAHEPRPDRFMPLIPYASNTQDTANTDYKSPFDTQNQGIYYRHWFGTDKIGRDIAAGVLQGTRSALAVGFGGMLLALLIGLPLGLATGFYGDDRLKMPIYRFILRGVFFVLFIFYIYIFINLKNLNAQFFIKLIIILTCIILIIKILEKILDKIKYINKPITIPFDLIVMRLVEVVQAVPILLWILAGLTIIGAHGLTLGRLIALIGCTNWVIFTRLVRGEMLRIRALEYMEAAALIGASPLRQMLRHALPNIITSALVAFSFGIANGVLLEAFLSFLGLGLPPEQVTWGTMLQDGRADFGNWWLIVFPGFAIFFTVFTFNCLGEKLSDPTAT